MNRGRLARGDVPGARLPLGDRVRRVVEAPVPWIGAFVVLELGILYLASHERYVPLTHAANARGLGLLHEFSQVLAVALVGVIGLVALRGLGAGLGLGMGLDLGLDGGRGRGRVAAGGAVVGPGIGTGIGTESVPGCDLGASARGDAGSAVGAGAGRGTGRAAGQGAGPAAPRSAAWLQPAVVRGRGALAGAHAGAFLALLALYPVVPRWPAIGPVLGAWEMAVLGAMVAAFLVFLGTALALVAPVALRRDWASPLSLAAVGLGLAVATLAAEGTWFTMAALRRPIEEATLAMSLAFYGLTGMAPAEVLLGGPDPVLLAEGYAIILAPVCSGYQGLFSAAALLGGYLALERGTLRPGRAVPLALCALGAVFVLNAARIALLFAIGVGGWPGIAENGFHSYFGVLTLLVVVGLAILALETAAFRRAEPEGVGRDAGFVRRAVAGTVVGPGSDFGGGAGPDGRARGRGAEGLPAGELEWISRCLLPLAGLMAAGLVTGLAAGPVPWLYPVPLAVGAGLLWAVRDTLVAPLPWGADARAGASGSPRAAGRGAGHRAGTGTGIAKALITGPDLGAGTGPRPETGPEKGVCAEGGAWMGAGAGAPGPAPTTGPSTGARTGPNTGPNTGPSLAGFLCGGLVFLLWVALVPADPAASARVQAVLAAAPLPLVVGWVLARLIGASVVVPLVEELAFRAGLMRLVAGALPAGIGAAARAGIAVAGSALAFGLLHAEILAGTLAGLVYGALVVWRGSLWDAILAHAVTNFLLALTVLSLGHWSYW